MNGNDQMHYTLPLHVSAESLSTSSLTKAVKSTSLPQALLNDLVSNQCHPKTHKTFVFPTTKQHASLTSFQTSFSPFLDFVLTIAPSDFISSLRCSLYPLELMQFLVFHSYVIGISFLTIVMGSLVVTGLSGHHAIIPLHTTRLLEPCRTRYCPIALLEDPTIIPPDYPPFQPPSRPPEAFGQPLLANIQITSFAGMI